MWNTELPDRPGPPCCPGEVVVLGRVFRSGTWYVRNANSGGPAVRFRFGLVGDRPVVWSVSRCNPAYPTVCIAPPPPDLDCPQVPFRNFRVLAPDPHRFDGDHDGIGCET